MYEYKSSVASLLNIVEPQSRPVRPQRAHQKDFLMV